MGGFLVCGCLLVARVGLRAFLHTESSKFNGRYINHDLTDHGGWWHVQRMLLWGSEISLHFPGRLLWFSVCMAACEPVSWWLLSFTLLCNSHNWVTLVGRWSFCVLMTSKRFHASCCKALSVYNNIFLNCLLRRKKCDVLFLTLANSSFAKIGTINCCNLLSNLVRMCGLWWMRSWAQNRINGLVIRGEVVVWFCLIMTLEGCARFGQGQLEVSREGVTQPKW